MAPPSVSRSARWTALIPLFALLLALSSRANGGEIAIPATFVHPGINYAADDLAFMRAKLQAKAEPWFSAWEACKPNEKHAEWKPHATADWDAMKDFYMGGDPVVAHKHALHWALTGEPASAAKAIEILNAWTTTLKSIVMHKMPQEKLASGICIHDFANAAELLVHARPDGKTSGWKDEEVQQFKAMLRMFDTVMDDFQSGYNGNWDAIMMNSVISSAIFLDDKAMFSRVVTHYLVGKKPNGGLVNYILPSGQCQESSRDQGHVQWGLGGLVAVCAVAANQGVDLYAAEDNLLMKGLEYTAKYMLGEEVPFAGNGKISSKGRGSFAPMWETGYQHYVFTKGLKMPYTEQIVLGQRKGKDGTLRPNRPEGDFTPGISWATLTMYRGAKE